MDVEFNAIKATLDQVLANIALIQRDDGALANRSVGLDQLVDIFPQIKSCADSAAAAQVSADAAAASAEAFNKVVGGALTIRGTTNPIIAKSQLIMADGFYGAVAGQLPQATGSSIQIIFKKVDTLGAVCFLQPHGSDTIDGVNAAWSTSVPNTARTFIDGAPGRWLIF